MRARDFVMERRRSWGIGDINLIFDEPDLSDPPGKTYHLRLQQDDRGVSDRERDAILKQLPMVRRRMREFTRGQEFWLYDPKLDKAVGLKVLDYANKIYSVSTVYGRKPSNVDKVIVLPGIDSRELKDSQHALDEGIDPYRLERLDPQTRRALMRMADHAEPGSWLSASEAYAMQLGLQYKNRDPRGWEQGVQHLVDTYRQYSTVMEGWRDALAGMALGAGVGLSGPASANFEKIEVSKGDTIYSMARAFGTEPEVIRRLNNLDKDFTIRPGQVIKVPVPPNLRTIDVTKKRAQPTVKPAVRPAVKPAPTAARQVDVSRTRTGRPYEALLTNAARTAGILDRTELAAFLAQTSVESAAFAKLREVGDRQRIERMYDIRYNPRGAKVLGNTRPGDGWRYRGRGFIMLTGRDNYTRASRDLGIDLVNKPELLMQPEVAARVAVWYWKTRVRPNVTDFNDTRAVTRLVQGGSKALERRHDEFQDFKRFKMAQR